MTTSSTSADCADDFAGADACFFCLGVSSVRKSEADYRRVTKDITLAAAEVLARVAPDMVFIYISGMGTDSTEHGRLMWARVKGETENALLAMPFHAYAVRPGFIQAIGGVQSRTRLYAVGLSADRLALPGAPQGRAAAGDQVRRTGQGMIEVARQRPAKRVLDSSGPAGPCWASAGSS